MGLIPGSGWSSGGRNGNPLQYSCLENPMDRGPWWATVCRVSKNRTPLKWLSTAQCRFSWAPTEMAVFLSGLQYSFSRSLFGHIWHGPLSFTQSRHESFLILFHANMGTWEIDALICIQLILIQICIGLQISLLLNPQFGWFIVLTSPVFPQWF